MYTLEEYISNLLNTLTDTKDNITIIRRHSRKLEQLGDISFPLDIKNWYHLIDRHCVDNNVVNIFQYKVVGNGDISSYIRELKRKCKDFHMDIQDIIVKGNDVHIYLNRSTLLYRSTITDVLTKCGSYGSCNIFNTRIDVECDCNTMEKSLFELDLSTLRLLELKDVALNFLDFTTEKGESNNTSFEVIFTSNSSRKCKNAKPILCGPVLNEKGVKEVNITMQQLCDKRTIDMRLMAQHRYKVQVIPNTPREDYFLKIVKKLGRSCVTIEMLSNKPNKPVKVSLMDLRTANKGAAFIFYNCARISVLLNEFEKRVSKGIYPNLPDVDKIDFSTLNQPEEWELFYVYVLQFPMVIKSCVKDILKGIFNPQYLITFLSNFSSLYSAYYRRVRILIDPREHLFMVLYARIYLLKALQVVFHNALFLLNIEPIKEM
ncbi:hypothetical protein NQ315_010654 [Exocentrus adspersus]|uniref:DALR anticodon binding domain-containing protein n=1 Tax=Exocentrus adspersus TaxID=1586481 RepID=A0AAV8W5I2_9CUCU|nr:hypothetical protein NQ315_010654 [Exocentrus adspersus]